MNIITVNVGQGALAIVRHQKEAIIVDCRVPASDDRTVAYVKEMLALSLKDHFVKGLILTGFDSDHSEIAGASIVLRKYRPDWVMYPTYFKDTDEASRVFDLIDGEVTTRRATGSPLRKVSVRSTSLRTAGCLAFPTISIASCSRRTSRTWTARTTAAS